MKNTKKTKKSPKATENTFTVTGDTDLSKLYGPSDLEYIHFITGYTICLKKGNARLSDTTVFKDCTFVSPGDADDSAIVSTGSVRLENCVIIGPILLRTDSKVQLESCSGDSVKLQRNPSVDDDDAAIFVNCSIQYVAVSDYTFVKMQVCKANALFAKRVNGCIDIVDTEISGEKFSDSRLALYMCAGCSLHLINARMENANVKVNDSFLLDFHVKYSSIHRIYIHRTCLGYFFVDKSSSVGLIDAQNASCGSPASITSEKKPLVATYMAAGFPRFDATMYKKVVMKRPFHDKFTSIVLELAVPASAEARHSSYTNKIRVSEARVVKAYALPEVVKAYALPESGNPVAPTKIPFLATLFSIYDDSFKYKIGRTVKPRKAFDESDTECSSGIHRFLDIMEAATY
jgi:hypothetical protein